MGRNPLAFTFHWQPKTARETNTFLHASIAAKTAVFSGREAGERQVAIEKAHVGMVHGIDRPLVHQLLGTPRTRIGKLYNGNVLCCKIVSRKHEKREEREQQKSKEIEEVADYFPPTERRPTTKIHGIARPTPE